LSLDGRLVLSVFQDGILRLPRPPSSGSQLRGSASWRRQSNLTSQVRL